MKNVVKVTVNELAEILANTKIVKNVNTFGSIIQITEPKLTKKDRVTKEPATFNKVYKVSKVGILLNSNYEKAVTNQLKKEEKEETDYKKGFNSMPVELCENNEFFGTFNGKFVIQYRPNDNVRPRSIFLADGKIIDKKKLVNFLPTEQKAQNQGTDREIQWRKVYLTNVKQLTFNGNTYKVID